MKVKKSTVRNYSAISAYLTVVLMLILLFTGCEIFTPGESAGLTFSGYDEGSSESVIKGYIGELDFGEIILGESLEASFAIENTTESDIVIESILIDEDSAFSISSGLPEFPYTIEAGASKEDLVLQFSPAALGYYSELLSVTAEGREYLLGLSGEGQLQLTVTGDDNIACDIIVDDDTDNKITATGEIKTFTSSTGVFVLTCDVGNVSELVEWHLDSSHTADFEPVFGNQEAANTTITIRENTEITADVDSLFSFVPQTNSITAVQTAIDTAYSNGDSIALDKATYTLTGDLTIPAGVKLCGGFTNATTRNDDYKDSESRESGTTIEITGSIIVDGEDIGEDVVIEGLTIIKSGSGNSAAPIIISSSASPVLQYNTITGGSGRAEASAVSVESYASPKIQYNIILGGTSSVSAAELTSDGDDEDNYKTYGIMITDGACPVIYANEEISGGTALGVGSTSFAIYSSSEAAVTSNYVDIYGNALISGGTASGSESQSYGIYFINNGSCKIAFNNICAGTDADSSICAYTAYGGNLYMYYNNFYNASTAIKTGSNSRVRKLYNNGFDSPDVFLDDFWDGEVDSVSDLNERTFTSGNDDERITITVPALEDISY